MSAVQPRSFEERLTMVEKQMLEMRELPERLTQLESQIVQLRLEARDEFSATRAQLREEIRSASDRTETLMRVLHEDALTRIATMGEGRRPGKKR
jgi:hypothetical protein